MLNQVKKVEKNQVKEVLNQVKKVERKQVKEVLLVKVVRLEDNQVVPKDHHQVEEVTLLDHHQEEVADHHQVEVVILGDHHQVEVVILGDHHQVEEVMLEDKHQEEVEMLEDKHHNHRVQSQFKLLVTIKVILIVIQDHQITNHLMIQVLMVNKVQIVANLGTR